MTDDTDALDMLDTSTTKTRFNDHSSPHITIYSVCTYVRMYVCTYVRMYVCTSTYLSALLVWSTTSIVHSYIPLVFSIWIFLKEEGDECLALLSSLVLVGDMWYDEEIGDQWCPTNSEVQVRLLIRTYILFFGPDYSMLLCYCLNIQA